MEVTQEVTVVRRPCRSIKQRFLRLDFFLVCATSVPALLVSLVRSLEDRFCTSQLKRNTPRLDGK